MTDAKIPSFDVDWGEMYDKFQTVGVDFGINLVTAIIIFIVGRIVARFVQKALRKLLQSQKVEQALESFVTNLAYWAMMAFIIIAAIAQVGVQTTSFIAVLGAAGLAIGLAMQGALSNFAAGVLIVLFRYYRVGDYIEAAGVGGSVLNVQILQTTLKTPDNKLIIVPNSEILGNIITNFSANDTRRVDMVFGVGYGDDLDKVRAAIKEVVDADERVHAEPTPVIVIGELGESSVDFLVRPWTNTADYWQLKWDLTEAIKKRFDQEGISIPFPQRDVHIIKDD